MGHLRLVVPGDKEVFVVIVDDDVDGVTVDGRESCLRPEARPRLHYK